MNPKPRRPKADLTRAELIAAGAAAIATAAAIALGVVPLLRSMAADAERREHITRTQQRVAALAAERTELTAEARRLEGRLAELPPRPSQDPTHPRGRLDTIIDAAARHGVALDEVRPVRLEQGTTGRSARARRDAPEPRAWEGFRITGRAPSVGVVALLADLHAAMPDAATTDIAIRALPRSAPADAPPGPAARATVRFDTSLLVAADPD